MRSLISLFLLLSLLSCGKNNNSNEQKEVVNSDLMSNGVPEEAITFEIDANLNGFSREQEEKILKAMDLIKKVVATENFKNRILRKTYNGERKFVDNNGMSNEEIYQKILEGSEVLNQKIDNTMNLHLNDYAVTLS